MKFIELRRLCNASYYALEVYDGYGREGVEIDVDNDRGARTALSRYADAEVVRFQPYINDDDAPALEVELNICDVGQSYHFAGAGKMV